MALTKRNGVWHAYFRDINGKITWRSTGTADRRLAERIEARIMRSVKIQRMEKRLASTMPGYQPVVAAPSSRKRVKLLDMFAIASKYRQLSKRHEDVMKLLQQRTKLTYADQITPSAALEYLNRYYDARSPKTFNNNKILLNTVFKLCAVDTGVDSPFAKLLRRRNDNVKHHAVVSEAAYQEILDHADPFWKFMVTLAYNTGMPKEVCLRFCPAMTEKDENGVTWATYLRNKTARFGRHCQVPLNETVMNAIAALPEPGNDDTPYCQRTGVKKSSRALDYDYGKLLKTLSFYDENSPELMDFHSLRASFITRCDEAGVARHATQAAVGHVSENTTNVYSHDRQSLLKILDLK